MSTLTAGIFSFSFAFASCSDDLEVQNTAEMVPMDSICGTRSTAPGINVNDFNISYDYDSSSGPFTYKTWRGHTGIFVNDGGTKTITIEGSKGPKKMEGYKNVSLPNTFSVSDGANVPSNIWKEVWAEDSDWELAFNLCGISDLKNGNFLGFYNKYSGILRIFTYVDECAKTTGSNHMWVMQMHDALSSHSVFKYGVPMDRSINKDAINQSSDMAQAVSPWSAYNAGLGFQGHALKTGWWAFDLDLSVYRNPDEQKKIIDFFGSNETLLSLSPLCNLEQFADLTSELKGTAAGSMKLEQVSANTENGIFAGVEGFLEKANSVKQLYELGTKMISPNPLEALSAGIDLAKNGCDLLGVDYGQKTEGFNSYKGEINLDLNATIDTQGTNSSEPKSGIIS